MRFILQPLVENAIQHGLNDYSSGGEIHISAKYIGLDLELTVADNGIGMSAEELERVRQKLENNDEAAADSESERQEFKTGVGLEECVSAVKAFLSRKSGFSD